MLGKFYLENVGKSLKEVRAAGAAFFQPFVHMVRPIDYVCGEPLLGTIEDYQAQIAFGSSGRPFGLVVVIRTDEHLNAVLMPAFLHADSIAAYLDFLKNDNETIRLNAAVWDAKKKQFDVVRESVEMRWPKGSKELTD